MEHYIISNIRKLVLSGFFCIFTSLIYSQATDSVWNIWTDTSQADTIRLKAIHNYNWFGYVFTQPDSAEYFADLQYDFAKKINSGFFMADASNMKAISFYFRGELDSAIVYYKESAEEYAKADIKAGGAKVTMNLGSVYLAQGNYAKAVENYTRSLKLHDEINDTLGQAQCLTNIGTVNLYQGEFDDALTCYFKAIELYKFTDNTADLATSISNVGSVYADQMKYVKAKEKYLEALEIHRSINDVNGIARTTNNLGICEFGLGNYDLAEAHYKEALEMFQSISDNNNSIAAMNGLGMVYSQQGKSLKAIQLLTKSLKLGQKLGYPKEVADAAEELYRLHRKSNPSRSLEMFELYIEMRDSIESDENKQEIIRQKFKYEYEKQAATDSITHVEKEKVMEAKLLAETIEKKAQRTQNLLLWIGFAIAIIFGVFVYNRFKVTHKQKEVIDSAYKELADKNKEIMDSILYAKRIQTAILPTDKLFNKELPNSFVLYLPKDVVAGDFYWLEKSKTEPNSILIAAADCTGHGVPGAMVSVLCNNGLNRSVREHQLSDPGEILNKTREIVIEEFSKSADKVNDGMDIALISLKGNKLKYAGAHNPLWIVRDNAIIEMKANKQPIGSFEFPMPYDTLEIELKKSDSVYIFSDGYVDQFGGEKGKKFKPAKFRNLLISIQDKNMSEQKEILHNEFKKWRGELDQVDDICIIGLKLP